MVLIIVDLFFIHRLDVAIQKTGITGITVNQIEAAAFIGIRTAAIKPVPHSIAGFTVRTAHQKSFGRITGILGAVAIQEVIIGITANDRLVCSLGSINSSRVIELIRHIAIDI